MAIDPVTSKVLAKIALDVATDEQKRKTLLMLILAPVVGLLLLVAFIVYIITSPLSVFAEWILCDELSAS